MECVGDASLTKHDDVLIACPDSSIDYEEQKDSGIDTAERISPKSKSLLIIGNLLITDWKRSS